MSVDLFDVKLVKDQVQVRYQKQGGVACPMDNENIPEDNTDCVAVSEL